MREKRRGIGFETVAGMGGYRRNTRVHPAISTDMFGGFVMAHPLGRWMITPGCRSVRLLRLAPSSAVYAVEAYTWSLYFSPTEWSSVTHDADRVVLWWPLGDEDRFLHLVCCMPVRYFEWFIRGRSCLRPPNSVCVYIPIKAILHQPRTLPLARYAILSWIESFPYASGKGC